MIYKKSELYKLQDEFLWATGIEDTFITAVYEKTGRSLDEYALTGHYKQWKQDLDLMKELGVGIARYGIPWHRINPGPGQWEWTWTEDALNYILDRGIQPIVDLVHYGVPGWIENAYLNPDFPDRMAAYAYQVARRFQGRIRWYTPFNEPRIAAWYCGRIGWWPPFQRSWSGFLKVLFQICRGVVKTHAVLASLDPENILVHVDATDFYVTKDPDLLSEARKRQQIVFLALDLIHGKVRSDHPLWTWILKNGIQEEEILWFQDRKVTPDILGINLYPMFTQKRLHSSSRGVRFTMPYANGELLEELSRMYWSRYQRPILVTETASLGDVRRRSKWLASSIESTRRVRESGIPLIGYTWWPMYSLVAWAYRQGRRPVEKYLLHMGLWDLHADAEGNFARVKTPMVQQFVELIKSGSEFAGSLRRENVS